MSGRINLRTGYVITLLTAGAWMMLPGSGIAQEASPSEQQLQETEAALGQTREERANLAEQREAIAQELRQLRQEMILAARDTQEREAIVSRLEDQLKTLESEKTERRHALTERQQSLSGTLGALMRLSRTPPSAVLLRPDPPLDTVRSAVLMKAAVPSLQDQADILHEELAALEAVESDIGAKLTTLTQAEDELASQRRRLETLIARKGDILAETTAAFDSTQQRVQDLASKAESLRDLLASLSQNPGPKAPKAPESQKSSSVDQQPALPPLISEKPDGLRAFPANGQITRPVNGSIISRYGEDTGFGQTSKGIVIRPRAGAQIVAPFDGRVVYAGSFQSLGNILIIEHTGGYHTVLAGFSRVDSIAGQWLLAGEPVGIAAQNFTEVAGSENRPGVYIELRRDGQPVNPLKWLSS